MGTQNEIRGLFSQIEGVASKFEAGASRVEAGASHIPGVIGTIIGGFASGAEARASEFIANNPLGASQSSSSKPTGSTVSSSPPLLSPSADSMTPSLSSLTTSPSKPFVPSMPKYVSPTTANSVTSTITTSSVTTSTPSNSPTTDTQGRQTPATSTSASTSHKHSNLNIKQTVGIVVGTLVGFMVVIIIALLILRRRRKQRSRKKNLPLPDNETIIFSTDYGQEWGDKSYSVSRPISSSSSSDFSEPADDAKSCPRKLSEHNRWILEQAFNSLYRPSKELQDKHRHSSWPNPEKSSILTRGTKKTW